MTDQVRHLVEYFRQKVAEFHGGCIKEKLHNWQALTSDPEILTTVHGLPIDLIGEMPEDGYQYPLNREESEFLDEEIQRLLNKKIIKVSYDEEGQLISPVFIRPKPAGEGFRLILNLKKLNEVTEKHHFKMETLKSILTLITPGVFMMKLDIKDAYYSVPISEVDQKLLKFKINGVLYQFMGLPNGYTSGPRKFTKLLKPILATLRKRGISLAAYLDDLIIFGRTYMKCWENFLHTIWLLLSLGFVIHPDKTTFFPCTCIEFLGFIINSESMTVELSKEKKLRICNLCEEIINSNNSSIRDIAKLLGKFTSSFIGVPLGKLNYRYLERAKTNSLRYRKGNYEGRVWLTREALTEINWWRDNLMEASSPIIRGNPRITLTTDASSFGWGAANKKTGTGGLLTEEEKEFHINVLECKAVLFGLQALYGHVHNTYIKVLVDNTATVGAINKMGSSRSILLHEEVLKLWNWLLDKGNWIIASHIPGKLNVKADEESRKHETKTEWMLDSDAFQFAIDSLSFPPEIDLFATRINKQLPRFVSYRPDPEAEAIDAFTLDWKNIDFYAFPPFICIGRTLQKINSDGATGIIIVPDWPNQPWYCLFTSMIINEIILSPRERLLVLPSDDTVKHPLRRHLALRVALVSGISTDSSRKRHLSR